MPEPVVLNVDCAFRLVPSKTEDEIIAACRDANVALIEYPSHFNHGSGPAKRGLAPAGAGPPHVRRVSLDESLRTAAGEA